MLSHHLSELNNPARLATCKSFFTNDWAMLRIALVFNHSLIIGYYTNPWSIIASATLRNPAMFAPFT